MSERQHHGFDADAAAYPAPVDMPLNPTEISARLQTQIDDLTSRLGSLEASKAEPEAPLLEQLRGQVAAIERAMLEHRQAIIEGQQRHNQLQQQIVAHNLRITALNQAIQAKGTTGSPAIMGLSTANTLVDVAEAFFKFLAAPILVGNAEPVKPNGVAVEPVETAH